MDNLISRKVSVIIYMYKGEVKSSMYIQVNILWLYCKVVGEWKHIGKVWLHTMSPIEYKHKMSWSWIICPKCFQEFSCIILECEMLYWGTVIFMPLYFHEQVKNWTVGITSCKSYKSILKFHKFIKNSWNSWNYHSMKIITCTVLWLPY